MRIIRVIILCLLLANCSRSEIQKVIVLQPLGDFPKSEASIVLEKIRKTNPKTILRQNIAFPKSSYNKARNRYRADTLIALLKNKVGKDTVIVGLSRKDISTTKGKYQDWGVMGLGYKPGNACVISSFRLSKKNQSEQFYKVVLHEIGHTQGLPHCPEKTCFMRDAEGGNPTDKETGFCDSCRNYLKGKSWNLR